VSSFFLNKKFLLKKSGLLEGGKNTSSVRVPKKQTRCFVTVFGSNQPIIGNNSLFDPKMAQTLIENVNSLQLLSE